MSNMKRIRQSDNLAMDALRVVLSWMEKARMTYVRNMHKSWYYLERRFVMLFKRMNDQTHMLVNILENGTGLINIFELPGGMGRGNYRDQSNLLTQLLM